MTGADPGVRRAGRGRRRRGAGHPPRRRGQRRGRRPGGLPAAAGARVNELDVPVGRRVGAKAATALEKQFGIRTVGQLLRHYPRRYVERGELTDLSSLPLDEHVTVLAEVLEVTGALDAAAARAPACRCASATAAARSTWCSSPPRSGRRRSSSASCAVGTVGLFSGRVGLYQGTSPARAPGVRRAAGRRRGRRAGAGGQADPDLPRGRRHPVLAGAGRDRTRSWPPCRRCRTRCRDERRGPAAGCSASTRPCASVHDPATMADAKAASARLKFEEAFVLQSALLRRRAALAALASHPAPRRARTACWPRFDARLPFELTRGQRAVGEQLAADLAGASPMHRLLQGEVGSGKTLVALRAMLTVVDAGRPGRAAGADRGARRAAPTGRSPRCSATSPRRACSAAPTWRPGWRC